MDLSRRDLELFLVLADERSFTRASARCNLSQSALSFRIKALEEGLGVVLFNRTTRAVELTNEGQLFEMSARRLHGELTEVLENFRDHAARRKGRVKIAAIPSVCASWLPGIFASFRERYPGIELSLTDGLSQLCLDLVRSGDVDMAITSALNVSDDLQATLIGIDHFHLVCPKDHVLMKRRKVTVDDLIEHPFVHVSKRSSVRQHIDVALHPLVLNARVEVQYMGTIAGMVEAGIGIAIVPALSLWQFRRPSLASRPILASNLSRPIHLLKQRGNAMSPAAQAFYDHALRNKASLELLCRTGASRPEPGPPNGRVRPATVLTDQA